MSAVARKYFVRATEHQRRGDLEQARDDYRAALDLVPSFIEARIGYATALASTGEAPRAAQILRDGLRIERRPRAAMRLEASLGDVLIAAGDYRGAEESFKNAAETGEGLGIKQADLHDRLARLRAKTGRFEEALDELLAAARARS